MSEVHRYKAVKMLTEVGNQIGYTPHGPDVVLAADFDRVAAERDALQLRLNAADQRLDELEQSKELLREAYNEASPRLPYRIREKIEQFFEVLAGSVHHLGAPTDMVAEQQREPSADEDERQKLIAYGRSCGLDEASTVCSRMAYDTYYPASSRFKFFTPKAQTQQGDLLIKAANAIASLPGGPYDRFKARQQKKAGTSAVA